jgi:hypothetical protein
MKSLPMKQTTLPTKAHYRSFIFFASLVFFSFSLQAQSGKVFHDYDGNGTLNTGEPGVSGIIVRSYTATNALLATATSNAAGNYTLSPAASSGQKIRIEFEIPASKNYFKPSLSGSAYGSNVQFITGNVANVNFAVLNPAKYTSGNPYIATPMHVKGNQITGTNANQDVLFNVHNTWGRNSAGGNSLSIWQTPNAPIPLAKANEIGTTYGTAWSKKRNTLYVGAYYRQFSGYGPNGPGAIYKIPVNPSTGNRTAAPSLFVNVAALPGVSVPADIHGDDLTLLNHNDSRLRVTTKHSLGDVEISDDETKLYTVNLSTREVIAMSIDNGTLVGRWAGLLQACLLPVALPIAMIYVLLVLGIKMENYM